MRRLTSIGQNRFRVWHKCFRTSVDLWTQDKVQPGRGSLPPSSGVGSPKGASKLYKRTCSGSKVFPRSWAIAGCFLAFARTYFFLSLSLPFSLPLSSRQSSSVFLSPSQFSSRAPCATWKPASYLSDPKQIFHGSIQSNLTQ